MLNIIKPFDIVKSYYVDLNGDIKTYPNGNKQKALFMVIAVDKGNIIACKITSQLDSRHIDANFFYTLKRISHPFLLADSAIQLDKFHTLSLDTSTKVGTVESFCRPYIHKQINSLFATLSAVLSKEIVTEYSSPNRIKTNKFAGVPIVHK